MAIPPGIVQIGRWSDHPGYWIGRAVTGAGSHAVWAPYLNQVDHADLLAMRWEFEVSGAEVNIVIGSPDEIVWVLGFTVDENTGAEIPLIWGSPWRSAHKGLGNMELLASAWIDFLQLDPNVDLGVVMDDPRSISEWHALMDPPRPTLDVESYRLLGVRPPWLSVFSDFQAWLDNMSSP